VSAGLSAGLAPSLAAGLVGGGLGLLAAAFAEIGHVPARALELEAGGRDLLFEALAPHAGHTVSGASDIFCKASLAKPQALHL
jgi:hypothetical protein